MLPVAQARDCIFLQSDNTCSIHQVRPLQCSTYPWWPDLMIQEEWVWERGEPVSWADCSACGSLSAPHAGWLLTGRTPRSEGGPQTA